MSAIWTADIFSCQHMPNAEPLFMVCSTSNNTFYLLFHILFLSLNNRFEYSVFYSVIYRVIKKSLCTWWCTVIVRCTETFWLPCMSGINVFNVIRLIQQHKCSNINLFLIYTTCSSHCKVILQKCKKQNW